MRTDVRSVRRGLSFVGIAATTIGMLALASTGYAQEAAKVDSGDTAWMLTSAALVLMMTAPGLALFYGGLVRRRTSSTC